MDYLKLAQQITQEFMESYGSLASIDELDKLIAKELEIQYLKGSRDMEEECSDMN